MILQRHHGWLSIYVKALQTGGYTRLYSTQTVFNLQ